MHTMQYSNNVIFFILVQLLEVKSENCVDEPDAGMCRAMIPRFYHDKNDGTCKQFYYGGCGGNKNNYLTMEECQKKCKSEITMDVTNKDDRNLCKLPAAVGDCRAAIPRWFYNEDVKQCEEFIWGGCDGNDNNFASKVKCEARCKETSFEGINEPKEAKGISDNIESSENKPKNEICTLPEDGGKCRAIMERYRFNANTKRCEVFQYGGCGGNENNFEDIHECEKACV